jgi:hypothetical protein
MPPSAPPGVFRQLLDERIDELLNDVETLADARAAQESAEAGGRARSQTAGELNQAVRRMRQAAEPEEICAALLDAAAAFSAGAAVLRVEGGAVRGERARGVPELAADFQSLQISLAQAPALASAVESRDPVVTASDPESLSAPLVELLALPSEGRALIFPVVSREVVVALAVAWGEVEGQAVELLAEVAGAVWSGIRRSASEHLVSIAAAEPATPWERLTPDEQRLHWRAQRFARVEVARIRLFHAAEVQSGRARRDLYGALEGPIAAARASFRQTYFDACSSMVDYLHLELVRTLAHDDPELLGENYPGVMA